MSRPRNAVPVYRFHKPTGQAYVRLPDGTGGRQMVYLGGFDSPESKAAYERVLAEARTQPTATSGVAEPVNADPTPASTVNEVLLAFLRHAAQHYRRPDGTTTTSSSSSSSSAGRSANSTATPRRTPSARWP